MSVEELTQNMENLSLERNKIVKELEDLAEEKRKSGDVIEAYAYYTTAIGFLNFWNPKDEDRAQKLFKEKLEPLVPAIRALSQGVACSGSTGSGGGGKEDDEDGGPCPKQVDAKDLANSGFAKLAGATREKHEVRKGFILPYVLPNLYVRNKAILMYGPPGTGKTELARAAAAEISNPVYAIAVALFLGGGAEFKSKWVGGTEKRIKRYFQCAQQFADEAIDGCSTLLRQELEKQNTSLGEEELMKIASERCRAISILFLDEIDAIAGKREGGDSKDVSTTNTLITQMEGVSGYQNVVILAATNRPWTLDSAIERRFGLKMLVDLPTDDAREKKIYQKIEKMYGSFEMIEQHGTSNHITVEQIKEVVKMTGFNSDAIGSGAEAFSNGKVPGQEWFFTIDTEHGRNLSADAVSRFGYSQSDMDKMLDKVFNYASDRALTNAFVKKTLTLANKSVVTRYIPYDSAKDTEPDTQLYFFQKESLNPQIINTEKWMKIPPSEYGLITTFDLRSEDFKAGLVAYPSTINAKEYVGYLYYNKTGKAPTWETG